MPARVRHGLFTAGRAARAAGITYRQLDYWDRSGIIQASQYIETSAPPKRGYVTRGYSKIDMYRLRILAILSALHGPIRHARELPGVMNISADVLLGDEMINVADLLLPADYLDHVEVLVDMPDLREWVDDRLYDAV